MDKDFSKYRTIKALAGAIMQKHSAEKEISRLSEILLQYIAETGDKDLEYPNAGIRVTMVSASAPKTVVDYKRFTELAAGFMTAEQYEALLKRCEKKTAGRRAYFK